MRTTRFSETEIVYVVKQVEMGVLIKEVALIYKMKQVRVKAFEIGY